MKRFISLLSLLLPLLAFATSVTTDKYYINDFSMSPGERKVLELNLHSTQDYYNIQVSIYLPEGLNFVYNEDEEDYIVPTDRIPDGRKNGWPYLGDFVEGGDGSLLVTAYSPNLVLPLEAGDGAIFTFEVVADEDFHGGVIECKFSEFTNLEFEKFNCADTQCFVAVPVTLADMIANGKVGGVYEIEDALTCVYITEDGSKLFAKDDNCFALQGQPPYVAVEGQETFDTASDFDQSNWVEITLDEPVSSDEKSNLLGRLITGVRGTLLNASNPQLSVKDQPEGGAVNEYEPNEYNPANFVTQDNYFLMPPKPQEYAHIKWGIYQDGALYVPQKEGTHNTHDLSGAVNVNTELYKGAALVNGTVYDVNAIVKKIDSSAPAPKRVAPKVTEPSSQFEIYVIDAVTNEVVTGIENIDAHMTNDGLYYNLLGQPVANPSAGIYIHNGRKVVVR